MRLNDMNYISQFSRFVTDSVTGAVYDEIIPSGNITGRVVGFYDSFYGQINSVGSSNRHDQDLFL